MANKEKINFVQLDYFRYPDMEAYNNDKYEEKESLILDREKGEMTLTKESFDQSSIYEKTYNPKKVESLFYVIDQENIEDLDKLNQGPKETSMGVLRYKLRLTTLSEENLVEANFNKSGLPSKYIEFVKVYDQLAQL